MSPTPNYSTQTNMNLNMNMMGAEQQHKFHHSHPLFLTKKSLREIDIPPRKLLSRRPSDSPKMDADNSVFSKFLPYTDVDDDDDSDPYSSDHFRMYEFKVRKCNRSRSHDWTDCPFAHPGEKARRRDPRRYHYSGTVCSEFRKGHCAKGDNCDFSHGVFECWLHPSRYRTEACKDGKNCKRKVCFFAHSTRQLRIVPETISSPTAASAEKNRHHCCIYCHSMTASPTSTLMGHVSHSHNNLSPPLSPPISPVCSPDFSPYGGSRFGSVDSCSLSDQFHDRGLSYKDALTELMASFEAMNANEVSSPAAAGGSLPWVDVNFNVEEQPQFVLSPSAPMSRRGHSKLYGGEQSKYNFHGDFSGRNLMDDSRYNYNNEGNSGGPDLGWVNDLLT